jgi:putative CocE/NonD family hydrolase
MPTRRQIVSALAAAGAYTALGGAAPAAPARVRQVETVWIPMPDGVRLAARLWLPDAAAPAPAIVEFLPYRRRDFSRASDETLHPPWAAAGYACLRVDLRGTGDSEGLPLDEYVRQEQDDGVAIIEWVAAQPWCSGRVGLTGLSWGGINALQIAARRPRALRAVIAHCFTTDRFAGDIHYKGGSVLHDTVFWSAALLGFQALPPDPATVGKAWRARWQDRLEYAVLHLPQWLRHQRRDAYWEQGSVALRYGDVRCPVYVFGGWADPYTRWVLDALERLEVPRKGVIGPWGHAYPHVGRPGPGLDYVAESLRWWDHWLRDRVTGIMDEPMLTAWQHDRVPRLGDPQARGRWIAERAWPPPRVRQTTRHLSNETLGDTAAPGGPRVLRPDATVGVAGGRWLCVNPNTDLPWEQSVDDARSLCFDSEALAAPLELLGSPSLEVEVSVDRSLALLAVRMNDVAPDGESRRLTYGVLNLCHRDGHARPSPLEPGRRYRVRVELDPLACRVPAGHRLRIAVSAAYWPLVLPAPNPVELTVHGGARLELPECRSEPMPADAPSAPAVRGTAEVAGVESGPARAPELRLEWDALTRVQRVVRAGGQYNRFAATGTTATREVESSATISADAPDRAMIECELRFALDRSDWRPSVRVRTRVELSRDAFKVTGSLLATLGGEQVAERAYSETISREFV